MLKFSQALQLIESCDCAQALFSTAELYSLADELELSVPDMGGFIEALNDQGHRKSNSLRIAIPFSILACSLWWMP